METTHSLDTQARPYSRWQNLRAYYLAVCAYMGIFIFGYDTGVGGGVIALPSFSRDFGLLSDDKTYVANTQGNVVSILQGGCFFGAFIGAPLTTWIGRKRALMVGCVVFIIGATIQTACWGSLPQFYVGRFVCGLAVGGMSMICPTYVAELAPKEIRGRITGLFQVIVVTGVAVAYWINYGVAFLPPTAMQWRIPIGFQLVPVGIMLCMLPFLKESPRWLATKHRDGEALKNLAWIRKTTETDPETHQEMAEILAAIAEEEKLSAGLSWKEALAPSNRIRFMIAFLIFTLQQFSGQNSINYYAPTIFKSIGIVGKSTSLLASGIYGIVKIVATAIFIFFGVERVGRRTALIVGVGLMSMFLWMIGAIFNTHTPDPLATSPSQASIAMAALIYLFVIPYCFSAGPIPWVYCSEIFNNRTRAYGLMTASASQWFWNFIISRFTPNMVLVLNKGGIFFFFAGINVISTGLAFLLPETRGRSLESMDILFGAVTEEQRNEDIARMGGAGQKDLDGDGHSLHEDEKKEREMRVERV